MKHTIEVEHLCTIYFEKVLASEVDSPRGQTKELKMSVVVDHYKNYIESNYTVTYKDYRVRKQTMKDQWEPIIKEWGYTMIDLAMDKYNEL